MGFVDVGTAVMALGTALVLYALGWVLVAKARPVWRWTWRFALAALFFVPALFVTLGMPTREAVKPPAKDRSVTTAPTLPAPAPQPPPRTAEVPPAPPPIIAPERSTAPTSAPPPVVAPAPSRPEVGAAPSAGAAPADTTTTTGIAVPSEPVAGGAAPPRAIAASRPPADPRWDVVPVFYGTDRDDSLKDQGSKPARLVYGSRRAGRLELGRAEVTVPKSHQVPNVERPFTIRVPFTNITIYEQAEDPAKHFTIREIKRQSEAEFLAAVRERLAASRGFESHALVFIHGYNTDFDFALYRTAQIAYDLQFDGAPFMYSWPSASGVTGYIYDRDSAEQAEPYLRRFLEIVVKETGAKNVSLIAHSMGNLPLLRVLRELGPNLPAGVKLDQIVLAAPDVDRTLFMQLAERLPAISRGITLYASNNDRALSAARLVTGGTPRAGDIPPDGPVIMAGIDTIDVSSTSLDTLALNHSLYAERTSLIEDIKRLLQAGVRPPESRFPILLRVPTPRGDYWRFP
jgi:esterase/lipase superfamily enzyme